MIEKLMNSNPSSVKHDMSLPKPADESTLVTIPLNDDQTLIYTALQLAQEQLRFFAKSSEFQTQMKAAFGDHPAIVQLQIAWQGGDFGIIPNTQVRSKTELSGAIAAFDPLNNTIYVSQNYLQQYAKNIDVITAILLEEIGHAVDLHLNTIDTPGDEGAIFASLVLGKTLEPQQLKQLQAEDDTVSLKLDGAQITLETATISDSGGFEGSEKTIQLDNKGGGTAKFSYQHFTIPDNFIIRYEGKNILETGFVGGGRSGIVQIPKGNSNQLEVIVTTNDEGTAWEYSVTADDCPDTTPLLIEASGGEFEDKDEDGDCEFTGTVFIGRTDGIARMLRVDGATVEYDDKEVRVTNGTIFSVIGNVSQPLFQGSFTVPFKTAVSSFLDDNLRNAATDFRLGGLDVNLKKLSLNRSSIGLGAAFTLPEEIGSIPIEASPLGIDTVSIRQSGVILGASGRLELAQPFKFPFFKLFDVEASDLALEFDATEEKLKLQGKFTLDSFVKETRLKEVTADLAGDNFIEIKDGKADIKGALTIETDLKTDKGWGLSEVKLTIDTQKKEVGGSTKITFPFKGRIPDVELGLGFKLPISPLELNEVSVNVDNLNVPIPSFPLVFFQRFAGAIKNFAPSDNDPIEFSGGLAATLGPQITLPALGSTALIRLDVDAKISSEEVSGTGKTVIINEKVATGEGTKTLNWSEKFYEEEGSYSVIDGLIKTENSFKVSSSFNINMGGKASANIPKFIPVIGGKSIVNGEFAFDFSNDGNSSNDYAAVWTTIAESIFGIEVKGNFGFKGYFDGRLELISSTLPPVNSFLVASNTPWITLTADWETPSDNVRVRIKKPDGTFVEESDFAANNIAIFEPLTNSDTRTVVVINPVAGIWDIEVVNDSGLGNVQYTGTRNSISPTIQVTAPAIDVAGAPNVLINYNALDADSTAEVKLFYDTDNQGFDGILIADKLVEQDGAGSFVWNTEGIPTGDYFIYAMVVDENNPPAYSYSSGKVKVSEAADLSIDKTTISSQVGLGSGFSYKLTVKNNSSGAARDVQLTETLSDKITFVSASVNPSQQSGNILTFNLGDLAGGEARVIDVQITAPTGASTFSSSASVFGRTFDPDTNNNTDYVTTSTIVLPPTPVDLVVSSTNSPQAPSLGENFSYKLTVVNNGPGDATNVVLTETLPTGVNLVSAKPSSGSVSSSPNGVVTLNLGNLSKGSSAIVDFTVNSSSAGRLVSTTQVTSLEPDSNNLDNALIVERVVAPSTPAAADLELKLTASQLNPKIGETINLTLTLTNKGPGIASGVKIKDLLPSGLGFVSATPEQGTYDAQTGIWDVGNIRDGINRTLVIAALVNSASAIKTMAEITAMNERDPDSTPGNNNATEDDQASVTLNASTDSPTLTKSADDILTIAGSQPKLSLSLKRYTSNQVNELGVFTVDDDQGRINGLTPGDAGYGEAALNRAKVAFSGLSNLPSGFSQTDSPTLIDFQSGDRLRFFLVKNGTLDSTLSGITPLSSVLFSQPSTQKMELLEDGKYLIAWEDNQGSSVVDFQDFVVQVVATSQALPLGAATQASPQAELIDLRGVAGSVQAEFTLYREAAFNNYVGFFRVADLNGSIDLNADGAIDLRPGDPGYVEAAVKGRVAGIDLTVGNQASGKVTATLAGDALYAPFLIVDGRPEQVLDSDPNSPQVYFTAAIANPGRVDHIRLLGANTWGFEDLPLGGDRDYNDVIVRGTFQRTA